jgi:hypothetical protein
VRHHEPKIDRSRAAEVAAHGIGEVVCRWLAPIGAWWQPHKVPLDIDHRGVRPNIGQCNRRYDDVVLQQFARDRTYASRGERGRACSRHKHTVARSELTRRRHPVQACRVGSEELI